MKADARHTYLHAGSIGAEIGSAGISLGSAWVRPYAVVSGNSWAVCQTRAGQAAHFARVATPGLTCATDVAPIPQQQDFGRVTRLPRPNGHATACKAPARQPVPPAPSGPSQQHSICESGDTIRRAAQDDGRPMTRARGPQRCPTAARDPLPGSPFSPFNVDPSHLEPPGMRP